MFENFTGNLLATFKSPDVGSIIIIIGRRFVIDTGTHNDGRNEADSVLDERRREISLSDRSRSQIVLDRILQPANGIEISPSSQHGTGRVEKQKHTSADLELRISRFVETPDSNIDSSSNDENR